LKAYKEYLECTKIVSEKRLEIQRLILQIKMGNKSKAASVNVVSMMNEIDLLVNDCKNKALRSCFKNAGAGTERIVLTCRNRLAPPCYQGLPQQGCQAGGV
jgi:hypothetical protein